MAQTPQEYFKALFAEAGIDDASTAAVLTHFANEKVSSKIGSVLKTALEDYPAQVGRVQATQKQLSDYEAKVKDWYAAELPKNEALRTELATLKAQQNGGYQEPPAFDASKYLTKEDLQKFAMDQGARTATVIKSVGRLASRHAAKFGEELDVDALEEIASKKGLPLEAAYNEYIAPREEEKRNKDFDAKLKAAKEEGAREWASRHKLPVDAVPQESAPINRWTKGGSGGDPGKPVSDAELLDTWQSANSSSSR